MSRSKLKDLRKNLSGVYPCGGPKRGDVPDDKIDWSIPFPEYKPAEFTIPVILDEKVGWADKELSKLKVPPKWNNQDGGINRRSHHGPYDLNVEGFPLNPAGRTGLQGRGCLGRWAVNHAADCLITRLKTDEDGRNVLKDGRNVLQLIGIIRKDTGDYAFPGGMIDAGEDAMTAVKREFLEEVFSIEDASEQEKSELEQTLAGVFANGESVYKGYVDDRRNTDNSWMETEAIHFFLDHEAVQVFRNLKFKAGSDAKGALWIDLDCTVNLYASHKSIVQIVVEKMGAYW